MRMCILILFWQNKLSFVRRRIGATEGEKKGILNLIKNQIFFFSQNLDFNLRILNVIYEF